MDWVGFHPQAAELLGFIPSFLNEHDPRSAKEQINANYAHGGGWNKFDGFELDMPRFQLRYPGDPPYRAVAMTRLHDEMVIVFQHAWVVILQPDNTWEAARID